MNKRITLGTAGTVVALAAGVGIGALITGTSSAATTTPPSASSTPSASSGSSSSGKTDHKARAKHARRDPFGAQGKSFEHGSWVSHEGTKNVTHDAIRGTVSAVSATSLTVKAQDGTTQTFVVGKDTKVRVHTPKAAGSTTPSKPTTGSISSVKTGDTVFALGTVSGSTTTANAVLDTK